MRLIRAIRITGFRSCKDVSLDDISDFSVLMGANNTGKSNILRAINLFFNDEIEEGVSADAIRDSSVTKGRKKEFFVEIKFTLPEAFRFHKKLKKAGVEKELFGEVSTSKERKIWIKKRWYYDQAVGRTVVDVCYKKDGRDEYEKAGPEAFDKQIQIERFLNLINLTYIPSHRDPGLIIRNVEKRIRGLVVRRYKLKKKVHETSGDNKKKGEKDFLKELAKAASPIMKPVTNEIIKTFPDIRDVKVRIPKALHDIALILGYEAHTRAGKKMGFRLQGSGFQTQLMFLLRELADTSYSLDFGWKQATLWCLEEPESFLHWDLEGELGRYFRTITEKKRLQIIASTHSGVMALNSFNGYYLSTNLESGYTSAENMEPPELVHKSYSSGVTGLIHALTLHKYSPLVFVEGISDELILSKASQELELNPAGAIISLTSLEKDKDLGGGDTIHAYLKKQVKLLKSRSPEARLIVVLDPDKKGTKNGIDKLFANNHPSSKCYVLNVANRNPELDPESFKGIEQFLSTRLIERAEEIGILNLAAPRGKGKIKYVLQNVKEFRDDGKKKFAELVVREGIKEDFVCLEHDLKIIKNLSEGKSGEQLDMPTT